MPWLKRNLPTAMPWRDVTSLLDGIESGRLLVMRDRGTVWLAFQDLVLTSPGTNVQWNSVLPTGLRPSLPFVDGPLQGRASVDTAGPVRVAANGQIVVYRPAGNIRGLVSLPTAQAMPAESSWPGAEA